MRFKQDIENIKLFVYYGKPIYMLFRVWKHVWLINAFLLLAVSALEYSVMLEPELKYVEDDESETGGSDSNTDSLGNTKK